MAENILMFFQQKFCRSISNPDMDRLIVDQLGCMAIARTDNEDKVESDFFLHSGDLQLSDSILFKSNTHTFIQETILSFPRIQR